MNFSNDNDLCIFKLLNDAELLRRILCIKINDLKVTSLEMDGLGGLSEKAWWRLGEIVGQNKHVEEWLIWYRNIDLVGLCAELQHN